MEKPSKILVTGATGLLGGTLVPALRAAGHEVFTQGLSSTEAVDFRLDTTDRVAVRKMLDEARSNVVINLVGLINVDRCQEHPGEAWRLNVRAVETLAGWVKENGGCHLIHISTDQVYSGEGPHREDGADIVNVYALSKYAGELAALSAEATVLRTNFFGPSRVEGRASLTDFFIGKFRAGERFTGFNDVLVTPLSMATLSAAIARVAELRKPGVYNLGSRVGCSKADMAMMVAERFGFDVSLMQLGSQAKSALKAPRPSDMRMDSSLFEREFDFILPDIKAEISGLEDA